MTAEIESINTRFDAGSISTTPYSWIPLTSANSVRVLHLQPASELDDDLHCTLVEIELLELTHDSDEFSESDEDDEDEWKDVITSDHESSLSDSVPPSNRSPIATLPFEAISYACGDFNPTVPLVIDQNFHVLITENLAAALRSLRYQDEDRLLWIDTVSINQQDNDEKSKQVGNMHQVYATATSVQIWLGISDNNTEGVFASIEQIAAECEEYGARPGDYFQQLTEYTAPQRVKIRALIGDDDKGESLRQILLLDYFRRRWIVQETTLAQQLVIRCGRYQLAWDVFAQFLAVLRLCVTVIPAAQSTQLWLGSIPHAAAFSMLKIRRQHQDGGTPSDQNLVALLKEYELSACRDHHDLIYSLLGAANDLHLPPFRDLIPDYDRDIELVFEDLTMRYLYRAQDARMLHHVRCPQTLRYSFVPDWRIRRTTEQFGGFGYATRWLPFKAGIGENEQPVQIRLTSDQRPAIMGWYVDEILEAHQFAFPPGEGYDRVFPAQLATWPIAVWSEMYEECRPPGVNGYPFTGENVDTAFARTLVADNQLDKIKGYLSVDREVEVIESYVKDVLAGLKRYTTPGAEGNDVRMDTKGYIHQLLGEQASDEIDLQVHGGTILSFLLAVAAIARDRCFFITRGGLIGLGPAGCKPDDVITVIAGAETPFVLRPVVEVVPTTDSSPPNGQSQDFSILSSISNQSDVEDVNVPELQAEAYPMLPRPRNEKTKTYTVVGECYVHGIMDGFFMRFPHRLRMFELR